MRNLSAIFISISMGIGLLAVSGGSRAAPVNFISQSPNELTTAVANAQFIVKKTACRQLSDPITIQLYVKDFDLNHSRVILDVTGKSIQNSVVPYTGQPDDAQDKNKDNTFTVYFDAQVDGTLNGNVDAYQETGTGIPLLNGAGYCIYRPRFLHNGYQFDIMGKDGNMDHYTVQPINVAGWINDSPGWGWDYVGGNAAPHDWDDEHCLGGQFARSAYRLTHAGAGYFSQFTDEDASDICYFTRIIKPNGQPDYTNIASESDPAKTAQDKKQVDAIWNNYCTKLAPYYLDPKRGMGLSDLDAMMKFLIGFVEYHNDNALGDNHRDPGLGQALNGNQQGRAWYQDWNGELRSHPEYCKNGTGLGHFDAVWFAWPNKCTLTRQVYLAMDETKIDKTKPPKNEKLDNYAISAPKCMTPDTCYGHTPAQRNQDVHWQVVVGGDKYTFDKFAKTSLTGKINLKLANRNITKIHVIVQSGDYDTYGGFTAKGNPAWFEWTRGGNQMANILQTLGPQGGGSALTNPDDYYAKNYLYNQTGENALGNNNILYGGTASVSRWLSDKVLKPTDIRAYSVPAKNPGDINLINTQMISFYIPPIKDNLKYLSVYGQPILFGPVYVGGSNKQSMSAKDVRDLCQ